MDPCEACRSVRVVLVSVIHDLLKADDGGMTYEGWRRAFEPITPIAADQKAAIAAHGEEIFARLRASEPVVPTTGDGCWCCGSHGIEHLPYLEVASLSSDRAKTFAMPNAVKIECVGQADPSRYKFGTRVYRLFATWAAWERYQLERVKGEAPR